MAATSPSADLPFSLTPAAVASRRYRERIRTGATIRRKRTHEQLEALAARPSSTLTFSEKEALRNRRNEGKRQQRRQQEAATATATVTATVTATAATATFTTSTTSPHTLSESPSSTTDAVDLIYVAAAAAAAAAISPPDARSDLTAGDEAAAAGVTLAAAVSSAVSSVAVREPLPLDDDGDVQFISARPFNGAATPSSAAAAASFIPPPFDRREPSPLRACAARFAAAVGRSSSFGHPYTLHADQQDALVRAVEQRVAAETVGGRVRLSVSDAELVRSILLIVVTWPHYFAQVFKMMPRSSARKSSAAESTAKVSAAAAIHFDSRACPNSLLSHSLLCLSLEHREALCTNSWNCMSSFGIAVFDMQTALEPTSVLKQQSCISHRSATATLCADLK